MKRITTIEELQDALIENRLLRLEFFAAVSKAYRNHGYEIDIDLLLSAWLATNPMAPTQQQEAPWGKP